MIYLRELRDVKKVIKRLYNDSTLDDIWWMCVIVYCNDRTPDNDPMFGQPKLYTEHIRGIGTWGTLADCYEVYPQAVVSHNHDGTVSIVPRTSFGKYAISMAAAACNVNTKEVK